MQFGEWIDLDVDGKAVEVYEPRQPSEHGFAVIYLHGHGGDSLRDKPAYIEQLERHGLRAVCPRGGRCWWTDVVCREFDERLTPLDFLRSTLTPWMTSRWNIEQKRIAVLGVSMGGQGALQLAYRYPSEFPVVGAISPAVDFYAVYGEGLPLDDMFDDAEAARQATVVLQLQMLNWPRHQIVTCDPADEFWFEGTERLAMKLASSGVPFEKDFTTTAGGHTWEYFKAMAEPVVQFLVDRLDQERRRLPEDAGDS